MMGAAETQKMKLTSAMLDNERIRLLECDYLLCARRHFVLIIIIALSIIHTTETENHEVGRSALNRFV